MTYSKISKTCPSCGSAIIYKRHCLEKTKYVCERCKTNFNVPVMKEIKVFTRSTVTKETFLKLRQDRKRLKEA